MSRAIRRAIYGKLAGDTTLTAMLATPPSGYSQSIFHQVAPKGAGHPYVIFQQQSETPVHAMKGGASVFSSELWLLKAVDHSGSSDAADEIDGRIKALLNDGALSISGASLMYLRRESGVEYPEVIDGEIYRHRGALYRVISQPG